MKPPFALLVIVAFHVSPSLADDDIEVCEAIAALVASTNYDELAGMSVEKHLGEIQLPKYRELCKDCITVEDLYALGLPSEDVGWLSDYEWILRASRIDVNNDGIDELRLFAVVGSAACTRSYFYTPVAERRLKRLEGDYGDFATEGSFCNGGISFLRYNSKVFIIEDNYNQSLRGFNTVWRGDREKLVEVCRF